MTDSDPPPPNDVGKRIVRRERRGVFYRRYLLISGIMLGFLLVVNLVLFRMDGVDFIFGAGVLVCGMCVAYQFYGRTMRILVILWIALTLPFWLLAAWLGWQMALALKSGPLPEHPFRAPPPGGGMVDVRVPPWGTDERLYGISNQLLWHLASGANFDIPGLKLSRLSGPIIKANAESQKEFFAILDTHFEELSKPGFRTYTVDPRSRISSILSEAGTKAAMYSQMGRIAGYYQAGSSEKAVESLTLLIRAQCARLEWAQSDDEYFSAVDDLIEIQHYLYQVCPELLSEEVALNEAFAEWERVSAQAPQVALEIAFQEFRSQASTRVRFPSKFPSRQLKEMGKTGPEPFFKGLAGWASDTVSRRWQHWPLHHNFAWHGFQDLRRIEAGLLPYPTDLVSETSSQYPYRKWSSFLNNRRSMILWDLQRRFDDAHLLQQKVNAHWFIANWYKGSTSKVDHEHYYRIGNLSAQPVEEIERLKVGRIQSRLTLFFGAQSKSLEMRHRYRDRQIIAEALARPAIGSTKFPFYPKNFPYAFEIVRPAQAAPQDDD